MDRREAERGRALVAAALAAQDEYDRAKAAADAARVAMDKARAHLATWDSVQAGGQILVCDGQVVRVGERVTLSPVASLDLPPVATPAPPPQPAPAPPPAPTKGGKK
jgi:type II secretory pathway pseudopilin PulG